MPRFRNIKKKVREYLVAEDWEEQCGLLLTAPRELVGPLFSCLPLPEPVRGRAAEMLGRAVALIASDKMEDARNIVRRLMWHMNEESGNIGWGIPEAFGAVLAHHRPLAGEFGSVLVSYIWHTGKDDNYCDHALLRRSCFNGVDMLLRAWPEFAPLARIPLQAGLLDEDPVCRESARAILSRIGMF